MGADYNFNNMYMWDAAYHPRIARLGDRLIIKVGGENETRYAYPVGDGDLMPALEEIRRDAHERGGKPTLRGVTEEWLSELEKTCGGTFDVKFDEDSSDYIYDAQKLATLAGKKLHSKRNHIHRFEENNDWSYEPVTEANLYECQALEASWVRENSAEKDMDYTDENTAIARMFRHFGELQMEGGLLRSSGRPVAFTIGSFINETTFNTHYEKAFSDIQGAYPMINREFAKYLVAKYPNLKYINREEDMGLENLRKAKHSYYPDLFLKKYLVTCK